MIVLDTSVLVYAVGDEHPLRTPSRRLVETVAAGRIRATTTVEVIQEFAHVRAQRRPRADAAMVARRFADLLSPLLSIVPTDLDKGLELFQKHERLGAFDALLASAALRTGADGLVSGDAAFEEVPDSATWNSVRQSSKRSSPDATACSGAGARRSPTLRPIHGSCLLLWKIKEHHRDPNQVVASVDDARAFPWLRGTPPGSSTSTSIRMPMCSRMTIATAAPNADRSTSADTGSHRTVSSSIPPGRSTTS